MPEAVSGFAVSGDVGDEVVGQVQDCGLGFLGVDVAHGVELVGSVEVDEVERVDLVAAVAHGVFRVAFEFAFGVGDGPVHVHGQ